MAHRQEDEAVTVDQKRLAFWEENFPAKGAALMGVLRPFYELKLELNSALPDLEERAIKAVFWRKVTGVRAISLTEASSLSWRETNLDDSLVNTLAHQLYPSLGDPRTSLLGDSLYSELGHLSGCLLGGPLLDTFGGVLRSVLYLSCTYAVIDQPEGVKKLQPLRELCLEGNFPKAFDLEGTVLIAVAD